MNYYVKGDAANADQIKAAFEKLGYDTTGHLFNANSVLYFTLDGKIRATTCNCTPAIIKTHPDYKELELPVEPKFKFKVEDWIVQNDNGTVSQITKTINAKDEFGEYRAYEHTNGYFAACFENEYHIWTIQDAKDGDVITNGKLIVIFNKLEEPAYKQHIIAYVGLDLCGRLQITEYTWQLGIDKAMPATKEQRDLLFTKMREAGYEWDAEKKELRKTTEPNFKVGDWVVRKDGTTFYGGNYVEQVKSVTGDEIGLSSGPLVPNCVIRLWTIQDAEDGDVLVSGIDNPFIYDGNIEFSSAGAYVGVSRNGRIRLDMFPSKTWTSTKDVKPATKEHRDLLFDKIREMGYEWDAEKKELKKNKPHYDIANFHAGMPVLMRADNNCRWDYSVFSRITGNVDWNFAVCNGVSFAQCIPFNDDTKHLLGTTDMPSEEFINW